MVSDSIGSLLRVFLKDGKLRPTLRVIAYFPILGALSLLLGFTTMFTITGLGLTPEPGTPGALAVGIVNALTYLVIVLLATYIARRFLDKESFVTLGLQSRFWTSDAAFGLTLGFALMAFIFIVELLAGWLAIIDFRWTGPRGREYMLDFVYAYVLFIVVAVNEELMNRGYILQNLEADWGSRAAVVVSSVIFALMHSLNPNVTLFSIINLAAAGVLFAIAYVLTRSLWLPIGLHFSWNFFQGPIFNFPVSGGVTRGILVTDVSGPDVATGGTFGPEGGVLGLIAVIMGIVAIWWWYRLRRNRQAIDA